ncbi:hypothetical protein Gohar_003972 [Gossypium harknessii]|uniref:Uncharacterized protein n=1 Tax=Gossypium harknessii TaxID=34285 RepID=A0A7J9H600_9ROSI|nr:hypothetical protein [Gossypium harknessii]
MPWERFVEAKKNLYEHDKNKLPSNAPNLYIDDIDWNSEIDPRIFSEIDDIKNLDDCCRS